MPVTRESKVIVHAGRTVARPWITAVAVAPGNDAVAVALSDGEILLHRISDGRLLWSAAEHGSNLQGLAFGPNGALLASGPHDRTVRLWCVADGAPVETLRGYLASVSSVRFAPDGRTLASVSADRTVRLWGLEAAAQ